MMHTIFNQVTKSTLPFKGSQDNISIQYGWIQLIKSDFKDISNII